MKKVLKERTSNLELLRVILMLMIFVLHYILGTNAIIESRIYSIDYYLINLIEALCIVSVNCFILLSGYFLVKFKFSKIIKLILQAKFYAVILPMILILFFNVSITNYI